MSWLWLALLILAAVCAVVTKNGIFISLIPASVLCCILDFLDVKVYIQAIVFVSFTAVLGLLYKFVFSKRGSFSNDALSVDSIVGEK
ncbi:MAG: hypothetical protein J6Q67_02715, partial [Clostridia bacterium]|nr:hypothetical protein [Clostridia bacterium]